MSPSLSLDDKVIAEALSWCGTPYQHQASCKGVGTDCLGLLRGVYRALYGAEPQMPPPYGPYAEAGEAALLHMAAQTYLSETDAPLAGGQVLLFQMRRRYPPRHVGIAISADHMVHALSSGHVCTTALAPWWQRHLVARFTFPKKRAYPHE